MGSLVGVYEFGLVPEGVERGVVIERCHEVMEEHGWAVGESFLFGVSKEVVRGLALAQGRQGEGKRLGWRDVRGGFRMLEAWLKANGGACGGGDFAGFREVACELDLVGMPLKVLREMVGNLEFSDPAWARGLCERKEAGGDNAYEVEYKAGRRHRLAGDARFAFSFGLHGDGSERRMAFSDWDKKQVVVLNMESGEKVASVGLEGEGPGQFLNPACVAYSRTGELYVSDLRLHRILVFDREGGYVRAIGGEGSGQGQLCCPLGLCFTADGNLVVADGVNDRVQVFREDGTFVRAFGSRGSGEGQFSGPWSVSAGGDGGIAVVDKGNDRVQIFDREGRFVRSIGSKGRGPGQFLFLNGVAVGGGGEIIVSDPIRKYIQVFSREGELLQIIGAGGDSDVDLSSFASFCADADGRLTVLRHLKSGTGFGETLGEVEVVTLT